MLGVRRLTTLALVAGLLLACTPGNAPPKNVASAGRTTSPAACADNQPAPRFAPSAASDRNLVIAWFKGPHGPRASFAVRDITDILHPTTVNTFEDLWSLQFVSSAEVSYEDRGSLTRMPLSGSPKRSVAQCASWFAWSRDGTSAAYIDWSYFSSAPKQSHLHLVTAGRNRVADVLPQVGASGCESRMCAERFGGGFTYAPSGAYISLVRDLAGQVFRIWDSEGKLLKSIQATTESETPRMPVWSGDTFYWRDDKGVEMWRGGIQSLLFPGLAWIHPNASPGGGQIVFQTRDSAGVAHVNLLDTGAGKIRELVKSRSGPRYLNAHLIWYVEERPCVSGDPHPCGPESTTIETGKTYIYDLQDNTETESVIAAVFDVWPHAA